MPFPGHWGICDGGDNTRTSELLADAPEEHNIQLASVHPRSESDASTCENECSDADHHARLSEVNMEPDGWSLQIDGAGLSNASPVTGYAEDVKDHVRLSHLRLPDALFLGCKM